MTWAKTMGSGLSARILAAKPCSVTVKRSTVKVSAGGGPVPTRSTGSISRNAAIKSDKAAIGSPYDQTLLEPISILSAYEMGLRNL